MLDILYTEKLCIHDWPTGVPLPSPDFDLKALSASQLCALVTPYLRLHLGAMYKAELGLDNDNNDDSEVEAGKAKKHKGMSKKSGDKGRKKGAVVEEPSVMLHISRWPETRLFTPSKTQRSSSRIFCKTTPKMTLLDTAPNSFVLNYGSFALQPGSFALNYGSFALQSGSFTLNYGSFTLNYGSFALQSGSFILNYGSFALNYESFTLQSGSFALQS
ncbi:hypothetical protein BDR04DRAFT_1115835 [Suillus decipiens]|nr:hypothetical protein BDR04DRAFT_1115835 [Suillus decipiens]